MAQDVPNPAVSLAAELERTIQRALGDAAARRHRHATLEHLLLAMTQDSDATAVMAACNVDVEKLADSVLSYLDTELDDLDEMRVEEGDVVEPTPTSGFQRVVQRAILHRQSGGGGEVTGAGLLVALFSERESYAVYFLQQQDMSRLDAVSFISHGVSKTSDPVDRDFFISYAARDEAMARDINAVLTAAGYSTVAQFQDFVSGNFVRAMQLGLQRAARMIVLLSNDYERSDHCQAEWAAGYNEDPGGRKGKLIPFLLEPTELNPLARQIVYTSLVGLDRPARHLAVLNAVRRIAKPLARSEVVREAARVASPDVQVSERRLDAVPNATLDTPTAAHGLAELPHTLRTIAEAVTVSLPSNAPPVVATCLRAYASHLAERGAQPIMGLLTALAGAVEREFRSSDVELWGVGLEGLLRDFCAKHALFTTFFPRSEERERFFAETPIDEHRAVGDTLARPVREASDALRILSQEGFTTPQFDDVVAGQRQQAIDLASVPPGDQPSNIATSKRRFVLGSIGFYERVLSVLGSTAKLFDSPAIGEALRVVRRSVESLLHLLR